MTKVQEAIAKAHTMGANEMLDRIRASIREYYEVVAAGQDPAGRVGLDSEIATLLDAIRDVSHRPHAYIGTATDSPPLSAHDKAVDRLEG